MLHPARRSSSSMRVLPSNRHSQSSISIHSSLDDTKLYRIQLEHALKRAAQEHSDYGKNSLSSRRTKLVGRLTKWRATQASLLPLVDVIGRQDCPIEKEQLFLPSDFDLAKRQSLNLVSLGVNEARLREGQAFDALLKIRSHVKAIRTMLHRKAKDVRGVTAHTRSMACIKDAESRRDAQIAIYESARQALIRLDVMDDSCDSQFPKLEEKDLERNSTEARRQVGDSKRYDGKMWSVHGRKGVSNGLLSLGSHVPNDAENQSDWETVEEHTGLQPNDKSRASHMLIQWWLKLTRLRIATVGTQLSRRRECKSIQNQDLTCWSTSF